MSDEIVHIFGQNVPAWHDFNFTLMDGVLVTGVIKVNVYEALQRVNKPFHFWELRRILESLGYGRSDGLHRVIKQFLTDWENALRLFDLSITDHFHYSQKSGRNRGLDLSTCTSEYEVSTLLFMLICLVVTDQGRGARCSRAEKALEQFLCVIFPSTAQATGCNLEVDDDDLGFCVHESVGGMCQHVAAAQLHLQTMQRVPFLMTPQFVLASHMRYLFATFRTCASTRSWMGGILCFVCHHVEKNFDELENFKRSLLEDGEDLVMHGGKKRRRLDVDLINAITGSPGSRVAATTGVLLRTKSKIYASDHKSTELDEAYMLKHQASTWMGFSSARVVGLIF